MREFAEMTVEEKAFTIACIEIKVEEEKKAEKKAKRAARKH